MSARRVVKRAEPQPAEEVAGRLGLRTRGSSQGLSAYKWPGEQSLSGHQEALEEGEVKVTLTREKMLNCPENEPRAGVNREYEERIYDYYGRPTYWEETNPAARANR